MAYRSCLSLALIAEPLGLRSLQGVDAIAMRIQPAPTPNDDKPWIAVGQGWLRLTPDEAIALGVPLPATVVSPAPPRRRGRARGRRADTRLTPAVLARIRALRASGAGLAAIAAAVGLARSTVSRGLRA